MRKQVYATWCTRGNIEYTHGGHVYCVLCTIFGCPCSRTYAQLNHTGHNRRIPTVLDAQQLLARLHAQIARLMAGTLQQKAMLSTVHRLGLLHNAKHGLIHLVHHQGFANAGHIELQRIERKEERREHNSINRFQANVPNEIWLNCM